MEEQESEDSDEGDIVKTTGTNPHVADENDDVIDIDAMDTPSTKPSETPASSGDVKLVKVRNSNGRAEFLETAGYSRVAASLTVPLLLLSGLLRGVL